MAEFSKMKENPALALTFTQLFMAKAYQELPSLNSALKGGVNKSTRTAPTNKSN